jgi:radical SAM protein with 4Fe4S-binding SPASM domain
MTAHGDTGIEPVARIPSTCVWEITLACNARCVHCGSSAGTARPRELDTAEALALALELGQLGCKSVTLSGGEPLLRADWPVLAAAIRAAGMRLEMITNGLLVAAHADGIRDAGFAGVTFSIDGTAPVHDALRGVPGGLEQLLRGAGALRKRGVRVGAVTQVNRRNVAQLGEIQSMLASAGFEGWQLQLTMPMGRAAHDVDNLCLPPAEVPALEQTIIALRARPGLFVDAADNIGYMSRDEPRLRSRRDEPARFWTGCPAGLTVVGITSDGTVRGCLSLPPAADEGNVRDRSLSAIWRDPASFSYNRRFDANRLGGPCTACPFGRICRGGCRSLAWATSPGNPHANPYCIRHVTEKAGASVVDPR